MRKIDGKFSTDGVRVFNTVSGENVPEDEPLFLLRARDHVAVIAIEAYLEACALECNELHLRGIIEVQLEFYKFQIQHPERMKQPGITRHLKLEKTPPMIVSEVGRMEMRENCVIWKCVAGVEAGLVWRPVLTKSQLMEAIKRAEGKEPSDDRK